MEAKQFEACEQTNLNHLLSKGMLQDKEVVTNLLALCGRAKHL